MATETATVLWRMFRSGRDNARAVILPGGPPFTITFFANDAMERVENYDTMDMALFRADDVRRSLESDGWTSEQTPATGNRQSADDKSRREL